MLVAESRYVSAGSKEICRAEAQIIATNEYDNRVIIKAECKLDTCGSVSLAHSRFLRDIGPCAQHNLEAVSLNGIGGKSGRIDQVGTLTLLKPNGDTVKILCYVFDKPLGTTDKIILLSLKSIWDSRIHIVHHMCHSVEGMVASLKFLDNSRPIAAVKPKCAHRKHNWQSSPDSMFAKFEEKVRNGGKTPQRIVRATKSYMRYLKQSREEEEDHSLLCEVAGHKVITASSKQQEDLWRIEDGMASSPTSALPIKGGVMAENAEHNPSHGEYMSLMTEIQLRRIVDRLSRAKATQETDGDEVMQKDGVTVSKFSKEAILLGEEVSEALRLRVYANFDKYKGFDSVFPPKNGAPRIMTKFKDTPYSYELLPEYANGERHFPCVKAMNWTGKTATAQVIRGFVKSTPVVEKCRKPPRCISRLVIVPKFAPGQDKDDPNHGFRVCVNALVNKCLKPIASTIPLATDEIVKLHNKKYYLQADGSNAYWSIPVCEESKLLTAFHTPDGLYCWNRLLMGAKPSSAVQQAAYLEALDQYIDYNDDGTLRDCLKDEHGNHAKDSEGNMKTLRHHFAVYCDDIAAGADSLEELWELYDALISCCHRAGIQIKAAKVKFGVRKVTFHNYTISSEGTEPKEANLCPIRSMKTPTDVRQIRAFLGCCQQLSQYVKDYGIIARPLSNLTKKNVIFPKPWVKGTDYDIAFKRLKAVMLDGARYLFNKNPAKRLFIEVDASDAGWGACAYQMVKPFQGDPAEEGRARINDKGPRRVIQWISKSWSAHELKMPVFYRESLARLLALEKFRNLIETNISAGITLYTDHKPGLYESSLSNKGQLSAWRLLENADLLSIVDNQYRPGTQMLLADPLSRICAPSSGFYDATLPAKVGALLKHLPQTVRDMRDIRVFANKDSASVARLVQKWRTPTNPVKQGRLLSSPPNEQSFSIGALHADAGVKDIEALVMDNLNGHERPFAILTPVTLLTEIGRRDNDNSGNVLYNSAIANAVKEMSKIVLAKTGEVWLLHLNAEPKTEIVLTAEAIGCSDSDALEICQDAIEDHHQLILEHPQAHPTENVNQLISTRSKRNAQKEKETFGEPASQVIDIGKFEEQEPVVTWINHQLDGQKMPPNVHKSIISSIEGYPDGLLGIPSDTGGPPRIIVPVSAQKELVLKTHRSIHHQRYQKVQHILYPLFYWPGMDADIQKWCDTCDTCRKANVRRLHLRAKMNLQAASPVKLPRQAYGIDFYGYHGGEILVIVDLCSREVILRALPNRNQKGVVKALLSSVIFTNGIPDIIRSDNAPELMQGVVADICKYLGIQQIPTGGYHPRGNAICERVNQTLGSMIRKLTDEEYRHLPDILPSMQYAINCTYNSAIGATPFEVGHGLPPKTLTQARLAVKAVLSDLGGGKEDDILEDVSTEFDKSMVHNTLELATRLSNLAVEESNWQRRMTAERLNAAGNAYDPKSRLPLKSQVYFYKPPSMAEAMKRGRKVKHLDHYVGPATITKHIGSRSYLLEHTVTKEDGTQITRTYQRDIGMVVPANRLSNRRNRAKVDALKRVPTKVCMHTPEIPPREGELVLLKDDLSSQDWYCARIINVLPDKIKLHLFTTDLKPLPKYRTTSTSKRAEHLRKATFSPTWCKQMGAGEPTIIPPKGKAYDRDIWSIRLPMDEWDQLVLVRNVGLNSRGHLDPSTLALAAKLPIPHHYGAGGSDDFVDEESFKKHMRRVKARKR